MHLKLRTQAKKNLTSKTLYYSSKLHSGLTAGPSLTISVNMTIRKIQFMKKYYEMYIFI